MDGEYTQLVGASLLWPTGTALFALMRHERICQAIADMFVAHDGIAIHSSTGARTWSGILVGRQPMV